MTLYEGLLFLHILGAIVWVGGNITFQFVGLRALASGEPVRIAALGRDADWIGLRVYTPAALVVVLAGIGMVMEGDIGFGRGWVIAGIAGFAYSFLAGSFYNGPRSRKIGEAIDAGRAGTPEVDQGIRRLLLSARLELAVLLFVVFNMAVKPWD
jgi:uncharacterized membrane protein